MIPYYILELYIAKFQYGRATLADGERGGGGGTYHIPAWNDLYYPAYAETTAFLLVQLL